MQPLRQRDEVYGGARFVDRHGYRVLLDTVPAWFCEQCGEAYSSKVDVESLIIRRFVSSVPLR